MVAEIGDPTEDTSKVAGGDGAVTSRNWRDRTTGAVQDVLTEEALTLEG